MGLGAIRLVPDPRPLTTAMLTDLRYAVRTLRKSPGFATAAILTLALAVGSNTAVFSVVNGVLLRPLPFAEQDRLFMLGEQSRQGGFRPPSYPTFLDWQAQSSAFARLAYVRGGGQRLAGPDGIQSIVVSVVSPGFFATLGEHPLLGRLFTPDEERGGADAAATRARCRGGPRSHDRLRQRGEPGPGARRRARTGARHSSGLGSWTRAGGETAPNRKRRACGFGRDTGRGRRVFGYCIAQARCASGIAPAGHGVG